MTLDLDFSAVLDNAFTIINSLWPVLALPIGFAAGFGILSWIAKMVMGAFRGGSR
jgi:nitrate reductase NapE component